MKKKETMEGKQLERKMAKDEKKKEKKSVEKEMYESMRVADADDDVMEVDVSKMGELCRGSGRRGYAVEL